MKEANHHDYARALKRDYAQALKLVSGDVARQVAKQVSLWGFQRHTFEEWKAISNEEFAEFECSVVAGKKMGYEELTHVVAVGMAWMTDMKLKEEEKKKKKKLEEKMFGSSEQKEAK